MRPKLNIQAAALYIAILLVIVSSLTLFRSGALWWDETVYLSIADNLYLNHEYAFNINDEEEFRAPVFPAMIATSYFIFGASSETIARLAVFAASLLFAFTIYLLGRKLYGVKIASSGALLAVAAPQFVFWSSKILSEATAVFFTATTLYVIYIIIEENRKNLYPLLGALLALSFLTKYPLGLLAILFFAWAVFRKKQRLFFCKQAVFGAITFLVIFTPWMYNSYDAYGSAFGSASYNAYIVNDLHTGSPDMYAREFLTYYGIIGALFLAGAAYSIWKKDMPGLFLVSWFLIVFFALSFAISEKQIRYLLIALPSIALLASRASFALFERFPLKNLLAFIFVLFVALSVFVPEFENTYNNKNIGLLVEDAGLYLREHAPEGTLIMSQSAPPYHYYSKHKVIWFPKDKWAIMDFMYRYNVSYVEIDNHAWHPDYVLNYFENNNYFTLEYNKSEGDKFVLLYRYFDDH